MSASAGHQAASICTRAGAGFERHPTPSARCQNHNICAGQAPSRVSDRSLDRCRARRERVRVGVLTASLLRGDEGVAAEAFDELALRLAAQIMELANTPDDGARAAGIREVFAAEYVLHSRIGGTLVGVDAYIERIAGSRMPDMQFAMDDLVVQGDRFALRYHWTAPHGDGQIGSEALEINRVADGQVAETWNYQDLLSLIGQLGVIENPFAPPG
jgi:predicted ester cyclase